MSNWPTKEECAAFYDLMTDPRKTFWLGVEKERQANRVAAFGAIRRALGVARDLECGGWHKMEADAIRWAIRAALKQETP